jgi:hypothetical protein
MYSVIAAYTFCVKKSLQEPFYHQPALRLGMGKVGKSFALILILTVAISSLSLLIVKPACAQSIPTPSVPQFTVKFVNDSYSVTTTNSYTGVNETQQISNNSIEITIKNQPLDYSNNGLTYQISFNVRTKPHFTNNDNWTEVYPLENLTSSQVNGNGVFSYAEYVSPDSPTQSSSSYTVITFPVVPTDLYGASGYDIQRYYSGQEGQEGMNFSFLSAIPEGGQVDFQVEALVGHDSQMWVIQHPLYPTIGGYSAPAVAYDSTSGWSNTQTVTIGSTSASPSPTPAVPEFPLITIYSIIIVLLVVIVSLLLYMRKRRIAFSQTKAASTP